MKTSIRIFWSSLMMMFWTAIERAAHARAARHRSLKARAIIGRVDRNRTLKEIR